MIGAALGLITGGSATRLAATLLVGAALGATATHQVWRAGQARQQVQQQQATLKAIEAAQAETTRLQETADAATRHATERTQASERAAAGARTQLERLRNAQRARADAATTCPAIADRAATLDTVFGACAAALADMGRSADAHAGDALKLYEAWPRPPD